MHQFTINEEDCIERVVQAVFASINKIEVASSAAHPDPHQAHALDDVHMCKNSNTHP